MFNLKANLRVAEQMAKDMIRGACFAVGAMAVILPAAMVLM